MHLIIFQLNDYYIFSFSLKTKEFILNADMCKKQYLNLYRIGKNIFEKNFVSFIVLIISSFTAVYSQNIYECGNFCRNKLKKQSEHDLPKKALHSNKEL